MHDHEEIITEQLVDYDIFPTPIKTLGVLTSISVCIGFYLYWH